jgi:hypothetical protein
MIRSAILFSAIAFVAAPVFAANYSAKLATPTSGRIIASDISWHCGAAACQGSTEESRPLVLCESLARRAGRVENFLVDGRAFTPAELDRCNASVKSKPAESLAAQ